MPRRVEDQQDGIHEEEQEQDGTPSEVQQQMHDKEELEILSVIESSNISGGSIEIWRKRKTETEFVFVGRIEPGAFDLDLIKRQFGGGWFKFKAKTSKGKIFKTFPAVPMAIDFDAKPEVDKPATLGNSQSDLIALAKEMKGGSGDMLPLIIQMNQQNMQMMMTMQAENQKALTQVMIAAMGNKSGGNDSKLMEAMMPAIQAAINRPQSDLMAQITAFQKIKSVFREQTGEGEEKAESFMDMLKPLLAVGAPLIGGMINRSREQQQPQRRQISQQSEQQHQPENVVSMKDANAPAPQQLTEKEIILHNLKKTFSQYIGFLINMANADSEPVSVVDMVAPNMSDPEYEVLIETLARPDWLGVVFGNDERINAKLEWFQALRDEFLKDANEPDISKPALQTDSATTPGNS